MDEPRDPLGDMAILASRLRGLADWIELTDEQIRQRLRNRGGHG